MFFIKFISYSLCLCVARRVDDYLIAIGPAQWLLLRTKRPFKPAASIAYAQQARPGRLECG